MARNLLRIGCGGGFWGDTEEGPAQLVRSGLIDVLVIDYLAEITMSLLARARQRDPKAGFVPDFVAQMAALGREIADKGIRVVVNAGGVNPLGCREAVEAALAEAGALLRVAVVLGDDLSGEADAVRASGLREMATGAPFPERPLSVNAYLGAFPIAAALKAGADVVITGRCVDSALVLGPLIHAFGWGPGDLDRLAQGSLAGHIIECGAQATGGIVTDWRDAPGWDDMGLPIAECRADGSFVVTKPPGTGGRVSPAGIAEQILYEIGDPAAYLLPDVVCDLSDVTVEAAGPDRVRVVGARGLPPTESYKATVTYADGVKAVGTMMIGGREAVAKARRAADAILARTERLLAVRGLAGLRRSSVEILGAEATYGPHGRADGVREVILKVAVQHDVKAGAEVFSREFLPSATAMAQGITGFASGRPKVSPVVRIFSCLVPKEDVVPRILFEGQETSVPAAAATVASPPPSRPAAPLPPLPAGPRVPVPLIALAYGRSGDKGDVANIGILARQPDYLPAITEGLTPQAVKAYLAHLVLGEVERFPMPGLHGFNFLLHAALDGGGTASLRHDPQGKALAQMLLDIPIAVPAAWCARGGPLATFVAEMAA